MLDRLAAPLFVARTFAGAGLIHPERPDRVVRALGKLRDWGPTIAGGYQAAAARRPDAIAIVDERGTLTFREIDERSNRLAHALAAEGIGPGDGVAILARNHRWFVDVSVALAKLGGRALYLNTMFAAPQITDVCEREEPVAIVHDAEFAEFVSGAAAGRLRFVAWHDGPDPDGGADARRARRRAPVHGARPARRAEPGHHPHERHHRDAQGRAAQAARLADAGRLALRRDPAEGTRDDDDRRADVPLVGHGALPAVAHARLDARRAPPLRPAGHARGGGTPPRDGARGRAGDAAADHGTARRGRRALRHVVAARDRRERQRAARRPRHEGHGPLRGRRLQPLRVHRGRLGDDRRPRRPARRAGLRRAPAARDRRAPLRRRRARRSTRRRSRAASSWATRWRSRGTRAAAARTSSTG